MTFKIHPADGGSEVPVSLLLQSLGTLEELVHMFAWQEEGRQLRKRFRRNDELRSQYVLTFRPPVPGSFSVTGRLVSQRPDLVADEKHAHVISNFQSFGKAIHAQSFELMTEIVQDSRLRDRILQNFRALCPPAGSGYRYELLNGSGSGFELTEDVPHLVDKVLRPVHERSETQTVTGKLDAISFSERRLMLFFAPKRRSLACSYNEDLEVMLWENRRELVQVRGRVVLDVDGFPQRIDDVEEIMELDLSPFKIAAFHLPGYQLVAKQPFDLLPVMSEDEQLLVLEHEPWGLHVFAHTRAQLNEDLKEQLDMLWREYAKERDDALTEDALKVKRQLNSDLFEVEL